MPATVLVSSMAFFTLASSRNPIPLFRARSENVVTLGGLMDRHDRRAIEWDRTRLQDRDGADSVGIRRASASRAWSASSGSPSPLRDPGLAIPSDRPAPGTF